MTTNGETSVANQSKLNQLSDRLGGKCPVRIHFLDNSCKLFLLEDSKCESKDVIAMVLTKYCIKDIQSIIPYFAIYISHNGSNIDECLRINDSIIDAVKQLQSEMSKLVFMIKLYTPRIWGLESRDFVAKKLKKPLDMLSLEAYLDSAELYDENLLYLQYVQSIYNIITGLLSTKIDESLTLGAYQFLNKFGEYDSSRHQTGFLGNRVVEFIPLKYLKTRSYEALEQSLFDSIREVVLQGISSKNAQKLYMESIYRMSNYGLAFYPCTLKKPSAQFPDNPVLGISFQGIKVLDKSRKVIQAYQIEELVRWGYRAPSSFYFELGKGSSNNNNSSSSGIVSSESDDCIVEFVSKSAQEISDLLTEYAIAVLIDIENNNGNYFNKENNTALNSNSNNSSSTGKSMVQNKGSKSSSNAVAPPKRVSFSNSTMADDASKRLIKLRAVIKLQAVYRGYQLRRDWINEDAAILIQSVFRGYIARVRIGNMIEEMLANGDFYS